MRTVVVGSSKGAGSRDARFACPAASPGLLARDSGLLGDPLERDPQAVLEDVEDGYVSAARAPIDYGVVIEEVDRDLAEYRITQQATEKLRTDQRSTRANKLDEDPESVAERFRSGELDTLDLVRHYGVVLDWGTGELLPRTTEQYRDTLRRRSAACWS